MINYIKTVGDTGTTLVIFSLVLYLLGSESITRFELLSAGVFMTFVALVLYFGRKLLSK